jgi:hypothetical protein
MQAMPCVVRFRPVKSDERVGEQRRSCASSGT